MGLFVAVLQSISFLLSWNRFCLFAWSVRHYRKERTMLCKSWGQLKKSVRLLHLVSVDHLLDHHTADRTSLSCSQVAVIALLQVYANFVGRFYLKPFHCFFALLCEFALHIKNTFLILECCSSRFSAGLCAAFPSQ